MSNWNLLIVDGFAHLVDLAIIILDKKEMNHTYIGNGTYNILSKPGKHSVQIIAPAHKDTTRSLL